MTRTIDNILEERVLVLLVDDKDENLDALSQTLGAIEYQVQTARSGKEALSLASKEAFACILLDVNMPEMNGFQVAEALRRDERNKFVPIIFVTAEATRQNDEFEGYFSGAVDYLVKPLSANVVRAKVRVFAEMFRQRNAIYQSRLIEKLYGALRESHEEFRQLTWIASHDMREPIRKINAFFDLHIDDLKTRNITFEWEPVSRIYECVLESLNTVDCFRNLTSVASAPVSRENVSIESLITPILAGFESEILERKVEISALPNITILVDRHQFDRLMREVIKNAFLHTGTKSFRLSVEVLEMEGSELVIKISNSGSTIDEDKRELVFQPFKKFNSIFSKMNVGIGLTIAKQVVKNHAGRIWIESESDSLSVCFTIGVKGP